MNGNSESSAALPAYLLWGFAAAVLFVFFCALGVSYFLADGTIRTVMFTGAYGLASQVVGFYFGSSHSSQKKDEVISQMKNGQQ